jgi:hypothetical protein
MSHYHRERTNPNFRSVSGISSPFFNSPASARLSSNMIQPRSPGRFTPAGAAKAIRNPIAVFNGDFEADPAGSLFDRTISPAPGATIDFDRDAPYSGARSLRIRFDGTKNVGDTGVGRSVFLKPGRYRFWAYLRTREISTDEGVAFSLADPDAPKQLSFTTEAMLGTNRWKLVEHTFQALPGTGLVEVRLVRKPSWRFDNLIRRTMWVDQVRISLETLRP